MAIRVAAPHGNRWEVRRRWAHRGLRWRGSREAFRIMDGATLADAGEIPVIGVIFLVIGLVAFAVGAILFVVPAVLFVVELLLVVVIVAAGVVGRLAFGRPWTIEARRTDTGDIYEWKVTGWRASRELVRSVASQLQSTGSAVGGSPRSAKPR